MKHGLIINIVVEAAGPPFGASCGRALWCVIMAAPENLKMCAVFSEAVPGKMWDGKQSK